MFLKAETLYLLRRDKDAEEYEKFGKLKATLFTDLVSVVQSNPDLVN